MRNSTVTVYKKLQELINKLGGSVKVDGVPGIRTAEAIRRLPADKRDLITVTAKISGLELPVLYSWSEVKQAAVDVSIESGVPLSFLMKTIELENKTDPRQGVLVDSEGQHKGIGQFKEATWVSVSPIPYRYVSDLRLGLKATASLYKLNEIDFRRRFANKAYTDEVAYLFHNQGTPSALLFLENGDIVHHRQSDAAIAVIRNARKSFLTA